MLIRSAARCRRSNSIRLNAITAAVTGVDLPQDLQLVLNIRGSVLLSALLHAPDAPPRPARIGLTERANAISRLRVVFHPRDPPLILLRARIMYSRVRRGACGWMMHTRARAYAHGCPAVNNACLAR